MGWEWEYEVDERVIINSKATNGLPDNIGNKGVIVAHHTGKVYDYVVLLDDNKGTVRVKEEEIDLIKESE